MSNEELERTMQFIVEQQASFSANLDKERQENVERWAKQKERDDTVNLQIRQLVESASILRDAIIGLTHHVERHEEALDDWDKRGKEMDARLNALIIAVERHISSHQSST